MEDLQAGKQERMFDFSRMIPGADDPVIST
jgi:hypothetical protein